MSKFEELRLTLTQTRELAEKLKSENSWLTSENSQYKLLEKDVAALRKENKQLSDSEKSAKKKEAEANQKLQNYIYEATNKLDDMETEIQKQSKVGPLHFCNHFRKLTSLLAITTSYGHCQ